MESIPINLLKWVILIWLISCISGSETLIQACDSNDLLALKQFAGNLTNGQILKTWVDSNNSSCCDWDGVICDNSRVIGLNLRNKDLKGVISSSISELDRLETVDLSYNNFEGGLNVNLSNLTHLDVSYNKLSGSIVGAFPGLNNIRILNLSSNFFNGTFDDLGVFPEIAVFNISNNSFIGDINSRVCISRSIRIIDISMNHFTGVLDSFDNCFSLKELHADYNLLSGELPSFIYGMPYLEHFTINSNNISGKISPEISNLSGLKTLIISSNHFSGPFPDVLSNLTKLEKLTVFTNSFSGKLPTTLSNCSSLQVLDVRNNSFSGKINLDFTGLPNLTVLDLASNYFHGEIPTGISRCAKLQTLSIARNYISGEIPDSFRSLSSLLFLSISNNSLSNLSGALTTLQHCSNLTTLILTRNFHGEKLPREILGFRNLRVLALGNCGLHGEIPNWLENCATLEVLDLSWNYINGRIPMWIGKMENLFYIDFSNNTLSGDIPNSMMQLKSLIFSHPNSPSFVSASSIPLFVKRSNKTSGLQYNQVSSFPPSIYLSNNRINGTISPDIGKLKQLHVLDLSRNNITGYIAESVSEMQSLEVLDLSYNDLYGSIPSSLSELTFLSRFSVAYNHLKGSIPTSAQFQSFPNSSFEGNPGLCGSTQAPFCNPGLFVPGPSRALGPAHKVSRRYILGITISIGVGIALLLAALIIRMSRRKPEVGFDYPDEEIGPGQARRPSEGFTSPKPVLFHNSDSDCKDLTIKELLKSTDNFSQANIIGCGGFGLVYKATLANGSKVAIKRLSGDCGQIEREFQAEVEALSKALHKNLVSLQGYCLLGDDKLLIYSYMENGSLDYWLHECIDGRSHLNWATRLRIAQGAAHGLSYLHKVCQPNIVHRDIKSSNILLDECFEAHLADFGLSRLLRPYDTHVTTDLVGTLGYIPPEYGQTLTATFKGDVYSFGVVLLELLTGRRPVEVCKGKNCRDLVSWVFRMKYDKKEEEVIDTMIWDKEREKELLDVLGIACKCLSQEPRLRPTIDQVVLWLDEIGDGLKV